MTTWSYPLRLAWRSLLGRRVPTVSTVVSVALSVALLVGIERVREGARETFANAISRTDLIVGARGSTAQLLLNAVFRMGDALPEIPFDTYGAIKTRSDVAWAIPYALGDSHRGYRVVGTTGEFFQHYRFRGGKGISFIEGDEPLGRYEVALGYDVAARFGYVVGDKLVLAHGVGGSSLPLHSDRPFIVSGIMRDTATPIDRSLYVTLTGLTTLHEEGIHPKTLSALLVGAHPSADVEKLERELNALPGDAVMAVAPGAATAELWSGLEKIENGIRVAAALVVLFGLLGLLLAMYGVADDRRREMAILRALGAGRRKIVALLAAESLVLAVLGAAIGVVLAFTTLAALQPAIETRLGLFLPINGLASPELFYLAATTALGCLFGTLPAVSHRPSTDPLGDEP